MYFSIKEEMKETDERSTPIELFNELNNEFHFTLNVCATKSNTKCERYFDIEQNGLKQDWGNEICWMNPPYSDIYTWLSQAVWESTKNNATIVAILPMDGSTQWFHRFIWDKSIHKTRTGVQIRFPDKRYKFNNENSAKFATLVVVFKQCQ